VKKFLSSSQDIVIFFAQALDFGLSKGFSEEAHEEFKVGRPDDKEKMFGWMQITSKTDLKSS
jgi:hypothetical protein